VNAGSTVIELYDWLTALDKEPVEFFLIGWFAESGGPKEE